MSAAAATIAWGAVDVAGLHSAGSTSSAKRSRSRGGSWAAWGGEKPTGAPSPPPGAAELWLDMSAS
eukprot:3979441-Pyramimonas_sp.AAC.1